MTNNPFRYGILADLPSALSGLMTNPPPPTNALRDLPNLFARSMTDPTPANGLLGLGTGAPDLPAWNSLTGAPYDPRDPTGIGALARAMNLYSPTPTSALPRVNNLTELLSVSAAPGTAPRRRVFFSFHYQNDINRVNIVRNSWRIRPGDRTQPANWFDSSIWETAKKTGTAALKKLIHEGMNNTSVTCVLAGTNTWGRPWVRYEIAYALSRGNGLLTVHIDGVNCMNGGQGTRGPDPLDYLGLKWDDDGRAFLWENFGGKWRRYALYSAAVTWPGWLPNVTDSKFIMPLSQGALTYDYARQSGYSNLSGWTQLAADQARR